jgi:DNA-binding LacI/PurR family transcriptional regulator
MLMTIVRTNLKDVAKAAGVHYSTVSLALSNSPKLPEETRERIQKIAKKIGYQPDAALSALNAYRQVKQKTSFQATLAIISDNPLWFNYHSGAYLRKGITAQADSLGYKTEDFTLNHEGLTEARLVNILRARNISGLLFVPMLRPHTAIDLPWDRFSSVAFGFSLEKPNLYRVASAQHRNALRCFLRLREMGYRRVGLASLPEIHERTGELWGAAYDTVCRKYPHMQKIPFFMPGDFSHGYTPGKMRQWIAKYSIDSIVTPHNENLDEFQANLGLKIPEDIGFINIGCSSPKGAKTGIFENNVLIGKTMINVLVGMMHRDERGIPETPIQTLIDGEWVEGKSVRWLEGKPKSIQAL